MVVALVALFVAMGGVGYAAFKLPNNSVGSKQIKANAVDSSKIKDGSIVGADLDKSKLGIIPSAGTAISAAVAQAAQHANTAGHADTAGDASTLQGKKIVPLATVAPPGTTDQTAGQVGPLTVLVSCGPLTTMNQSITVSITSSEAGTLTHSYIHIEPDGQLTDTSPVAAGGRVDLLTNSFNLDTVAFVFTGGSRSIAGHFLAADSLNGLGCLVSGTLAG